MTKKASLPPQESIDSQAHASVVGLENLMSDINNAIGKDSVSLADQCPMPDVFSTGFPELDHRVLVIGGIPVGRVIEIAGEPGAGKSTLAINIMAEAIRQGKKCVYADKEGTMTYEYGETIGCPRDQYLIYPGKKHSGEVFLENLLTIMEKGCDFLVLDSLGVLTSGDVSSTDLKDISMHDTMSTPQMVKIWAMKLFNGWEPKTKKEIPTDKKKLTKREESTLKKSGPTISLPECGTTLIIINHLNKKFATTYTLSEEESKDSGQGNKVKFIYSMRIFMEKKGMVTDENMLDEFGYPRYTKSKITCYKNKLGPGGRNTTMYLDNLTGQLLTTQKSILLFATAIGSIILTGSSYRLNEDFVNEHLDLFPGWKKKDLLETSFNGKNAITDFIGENTGFMSYLLGESGIVDKADTEDVE